MVPDKYKDKTKTELAQDLYRRDSRDRKDKEDAKRGTSQIIRLGTTTLLGLLTGVIYQVAPKAERFVGPVGGDAILAIGGSAGAILTDDEAADVFEGVANVGLSGTMRDLGRGLAGLFG